MGLERDIPITSTNGLRAAVVAAVLGHVAVELGDHRRAQGLKPHPADAGTM